LVARQGFDREGFGPQAPQTIQSLIERILRARQRGFATVFDAYEVGTSAIATAICAPQTKEPIGTVSIAGPSVRMTPARMEEIAPLLLGSAAELAFAASGSPLFSHPERSETRPQGS
jgi:DNA-binding IclR family transcriptional regulator